MAEDVHLVSHVNGMHPIVRLSIERAGELHRRTGSPTPHRSSGGARTTTTWPPPLTVLGGSASAVMGSSCGSPRPPGQLTPFSGSYLLVDPIDGAAVLTSYETGRRYRVRMISGAFACTGVEVLGRAERSILLGSSTDSWEAELVEATTGTEHPPTEGTFDEVVAGAAAAFAQYVDALAPWRSSETPAAVLASYTLWSATVVPEGFIGREAVLMSKHWMDKVWSWDHCFNALALAAGHPDLALDQFFLPFDHQDGAGALRTP